MALRRVPIRRTGNRENLFLGGDRELVMFSGLLAFVLIVAAQDLRAMGVGIVLWFFALFIFRAMAKQDPKMRFIYLRNRRYQTYYPPRATPFRSNIREYK